MFCDPVGTRAGQQGQVRPVKTGPGCLWEATLTLWGTVPLPGSV